MQTRMIAVLAAALMAPGLLAAQNYQAGEDYRVAERERRLTDAPKEVVEFFWYGCGGCYAFLPAFESWKEQASDDVEFTRVPALLNPRWKTHGKAYYVAESLDMLDTMHQAMFNALHEEGRRIEDQAAMRELFVENGADPEEFDEAFDSFEVDAKMRRAENLARRFQIRSTPTIVVNGQYMTDLGEAGGPDPMVEMGQWLLEQ